MSRFLWQLMTHSSHPVHHWFWTDNWSVLFWFSVPKTHATHATSSAWSTRPLCLNTQERAYFEIFVEQRQAIKQRPRDFHLHSVNWNVVCPQPSLLERKECLVWVIPAEASTIRPLWGFDGGLVNLDRLLTGLARLPVNMAPPCLLDNDLLLPGWWAEGLLTATGHHLGHLLLLLACVQSAKGSEQRKH